MIQTISNYYNAPIKLIKSDTRDSRIVLARHMVSAIYKERTSLTLREIGEIINRKASNVYQSHKKITSKKRGKIRNDYLKLMEICNEI
ncbi:replication initiation protein [Rhodobacteraceae phage LS06-2018-MD05]|nr:replication initiation protein [Rhodobacteraceae phage LS06-2018-MD05]